MPWWGGGGRASPSDDDALAPRSLEELQAEEEKARAALDDKKLQAWQRADRRLQEATRRANTPAPPFAGLPNPSQYCFMNAAMQCMRHTPRLADMIVGSVSPDADVGLALSFAALLRQMDRAIAPDALQLEGWRVFVGNCAEKLPASNTTGLPLLVPPPGRQEQQDTGEFLDQLVDALSTEKNKDGSVIMARASSSYSPTRPSADLDAARGKLNKVVSAAYGKAQHNEVHDRLEEFCAEAWSGRDAGVAPTSRTHLGAMFQGQKLSLQRCEAEGCGAITVATADPFRMLDCHLAATKMDRGPDGKVDLQETLTREHRPHKMERGFACSVCRAVDTTIQRDTLCRLPEVLGIRVHRVDSDWRRGTLKKIDSTIKIYDELDLAPCLLNDDAPRNYNGDRCSTKYQLYAVVFHAGENPSVGHYYATVKAQSTQYVVRAEHGAQLRREKSHTAEVVGRLPHGCVVTLTEAMPAPTEEVQMVGCRGNGLSGFVSLVWGDERSATLSQPGAWVELNDRRLEVGCSHPQTTEDKDAAARAAMLFYQRVDVDGGNWAEPGGAAAEAGGGLVRSNASYGGTFPDVFAGGVVEAKRGTHRVDICRILNLTPYTLSLYWIAKDKTPEQMFDTNDKNWRNQKAGGVKKENIHSFANSYNGHCFGFSCEALGGFITKPSAIIKLHVATKQWYTVRLALTEDGSAHPDGPLEIVSHSTEPEWTTTMEDPSKAVPGSEPAPAPSPAPAVEPASPHVYRKGDSIEVWSVSGNTWVEAKVSDMVSEKEAKVEYFVGSESRYKTVDTTDGSQARPARGTADPKMIEQAVQEAMQMGFEERAVRSLQDQLQCSSTSELIEQLIAAGV